MKINVRGVYLALLLLSPGLLLAGITGKLTGRVKDASTGEPLVLANVVVKQNGEPVTGAATGNDGTYVISDLRAGTYTVEFSVIGYQTVVVNGVEIHADQVTKQDAKLATGAITVDVINVTAERPLIEAGVPTEIKTNQEIKRQPVDNYQDVVALAAGATETSGGLSAGLHVQGGRANEVVYVVDGINANDPVTGQSGVYIDNTAIQEMTINTGNFNAEYGDAMSAVINIVTREGADRFEGSAEYETDAHLRLSDDPIKYPNKDMWYNKGSLSFGGPMGLPRSSFFISGNILESQDRLPFNDAHRKNGTLKLTWRPIESGPKFTLSGNYSNTWSHSYSHAYARGVWLEKGQKNFNDNYQLNLKVTHPITKKFYYTVNVGTFSTHSKTSFLDGSDYNDFRMIGRSQMDWAGWAYEQTWWTPDTSGDSVFMRMFNSDSMRCYIPDSSFAYVDDQTQDSIYFNILDRYSSITSDPDSAVWFFYNEYIAKNGYYIEGDNAYRWLNWEKQLEALNNRWYEVNEWRPALNEDGDTVGVYYHLFDLDRYIEVYNNIQADTSSTNPWLDSVETSGNMYLVRYNSEPVFRRFSYYFYPYWAERTTTKYVADVSFDWNPNEVHWFKVGASGNYHDLNYLNIQFVNENPYHDSYHKNPIIGAAFIQDRIGYEDLVIQAGVRFDYFDPASEALINPEYIDSGYVKVKPKYQFSPRLSVSFAVSEKSMMYASYGHFFQPVELGELYQNLEADITVGVPLIGNPDLPPLKTVFYQAGYRYALTKNTAFELTGYYKDQENLLATREVSTIYRGKLSNYTIYVIEDFAKIKGIDVSLERRANQYLSGSVTYSFMDAKGTGSSGREFYYNYRGTTLEPPKSEYPLEFDITHSVKTNANFYLPQDFSVAFLRRVNLNVQFNWASGRPYWATDSRGNLLPLGTKRQPATKTVDAKLEKWFVIGSRLNIGVYIDVRNVFDWTNVANVYNNTGLANDNGQRPVYEPALYRDYADDGYTSSYEKWQADVADWEQYIAQNPRNYDSPRILRFGLQVGF